MSDEVLCIVEIPKGSRNKYEWDEERKLILFDRFLSSSVVFPTDYGFVAESLGPDGEVRLDATFFGESQGRFIVSARSRAVPEVQALARRHGVELQLLGLTGGDAIEFDGQLRVPLTELREAWEGALA